MSLIKNFSRIVVGFAALSIIIGCATARTVSVQPGKGGVVAVNPPQDPEARQKAEMIMGQTCNGKKWEIVEEGETVIGQSTRGDTGTSYNNNRNAPILFSSTSSSSETVNKTEWRINYKCI
ncbi:MAG: hypothetical protein ACXWP5_16775 [Bdellovibrionota bacterium]